MFARILTEVMMNDTVKTLIGVMIPLFGTTFGAAAVFFFRKSVGETVTKAMLGFASGVMIAASFFSLILPAIEMAEASGIPGFIPAVTGFLGGILFLLLLDRLIAGLYRNESRKNGKVSAARETLMLLLAVTIHNIPEGMAVGVAFAGMYANRAAIPYSSALSLSVGIAVQNIPEGAIISTPLVAGGFSRRRAFAYGILSGVVEPIFAFLTLFLTAVVAPILPYILSFAAGAMIYVVADELIPESQAGERTKAGTLGVAFGFALMMLLDAAL